jgi:hypothetical protein
VDDKFSPEANTPLKQLLEAASAMDMTMTLAQQQALELDLRLPSSADTLPQLRVSPDRATLKSNGSVDVTIDINLPAVGNFSAHLVIGNHSYTMFIVVCGGAHR